MDFVIANGADGFCAGSSTGEFMNLTRAEWECVLGICQEQNRGRVPMLAGTADMSTPATIEKSKFAESLGYDGFLIISPWYQVHTTREIEAHFRPVRDATSKPIMIYNNPPVTGIDLTLDTLVRLASDDVIQYIKDANSDPYMITRLRMKLGDKLGLFYGHDNNALGAFAFGATGWVSGSGNFDPKRLVEDRPPVHRRRRLCLCSQAVGRDHAVCGSGDGGSSRRAARLDRGDQTRSGTARPRRRPRAAAHAAADGGSGHAGEARRQPDEFHMTLFTVSLTLALLFAALAVCARFAKRLQGLGFTFCVLAVGSAAVAYPPLFIAWGGFELKRAIAPLVQLILLGMGMTLTVGDFRRVVTMPRAIVIGFLLQFTVMPFSGLLFASVFGLTGAVATGLILIGSVPGGHGLERDRAAGAATCHCR